MKESKTMTVKEAAKYLKMREGTVYRLVQEGQIPATKVGNQWCVNKKQISDWLSVQMPRFRSRDLAYLEKDHKEAVIRITPLLKPQNIIFDLRAFTKSQTLQKLVGLMVKNNKILKSQGEKLLYAVIDRERLCSTAVSEDVAIPHPRQAVIAKPKRPLLVLGICRNGMDFESTDGKPTYLIFLLSAPRDDIHLKLMARLSRLLRDRVFRQKLIQAKDYKELKRIISKKEASL